MKVEQEKAFALFELDILRKFGIKPFELEQMDMFTIRTWQNKQKEEMIAQLKKAIHKKTTKWQPQKLRQN